MTTFDGWDARLCGDAMALPNGQLSENTLMHYRTKGSKNGVRRYQTESGEWTPLGLRERKKREGWGDKEERKAAKAQKKEARRAAKAERKSERVARRAEAVKALKEKRRQNDVRQLTDEELKNRIERVKMETEYKDLTKSPLRKVGEKIVSDYLANRAAKAERRYQEQQDTLQFNREMKRLAEITKQKELEAKANEKKYESDKARAEADKARAETDKVDITSGTRAKKIKYDTKNLKLQGKRYVSDNTIRGGIKKMANKILSGHGDARANYEMGVSDAKIAKKQASILNKYNNKALRNPENQKAVIPEGGFDYSGRFGNRKNNQQEEKKKKK